MGDPRRHRWLVTAGLLRRACLHDQKARHRHGRRRRHGCRRPGNEEHPWCGTEGEHCRLGRGQAKKNRTLSSGGLTKQRGAAVEVQRVDSRWNRISVDHGHGRNWSSAEHSSIVLVRTRPLAMHDALGGRSGSTLRIGTPDATFGSTAADWRLLLATPSHFDKHWQRELGRLAFTMPLSVRMHKGLAAAEIACNCANAKVAYLQACGVRLVQSAFAHDANLKRGAPARRATPPPQVRCAMTTWCLGSRRALGSRRGCCCCCGCCRAL
jgi:hypothetical protein